MLEVKDLRSGYGKIEVLKGVSLSVEKGQMVTVVGANGAGKSTLINTISRVLPIRAGDIRFNGRSTLGAIAPDLVDFGVVQVPEGRQLFASLTVLENLRLGFVRLRRVDPGLFAERLDFVHSLFPRLHERESQLAATLSGGEQQMVAIGRALMARPELLILDEPSLGLAPLVIDRIFEVFETLKTQGLTILLVEQRAEAALDLADKAYVLSVGRIVAEGAPADVRRDASIERAYLGG